MTTTMFGCVIDVIDVILEQVWLAAIPVNVHQRSNFSPFVVQWICNLSRLIDVIDVFHLFLSCLRSWHDVLLY